MTAVVDHSRWLLSSTRINLLSCFVISCHVTSRHIIACHVVSCHVMSCHVTSYHISYNVKSCHVTSRHVMSCHVMSCHVMSCHVTSRRVAYQCLLASRGLFVFCFVLSFGVPSLFVLRQDVISRHVMFVFSRRSQQPLRRVVVKRRCQASKCR